MGTHFNSRSAQVKFLKGLAEGSRNIAELTKPKIEIWEDVEYNQNLVIDTVSGNIREKAGFVEWMASRKNQPTIILWANV